MGMKGKTPRNVWIRNLSKGEVTMDQSQKDLQKVLLAERVKSEQHKLNYEKLKALNTKLQIQLEQSHRTASLKSDTPSVQNVRQDDYSCNVVKQVTFGTQTSIPLKYDDTRSSGDNAKESTAGSKRETCSHQNSETKAQYGYNEQEVLDAIAQWKFLYVELAQEFQQYKLHSEASQKKQYEAEKEKEKEFALERQKLKAELEAQKFEIESNCRELQREKQAMHSEIRTLREDLNETREKLIEKTNQCESLSKAATDKNFSLLSKGECFNPNHSGLQSRLDASQSRTTFLETEMEKMIQENENLVEKLETIKAFHEGQLKQITNDHKIQQDALQEEKAAIDSKYEEAKSMLEAQQAYLQEVDCFTRKQEEQTRTFVETVQTHLRNVLSEVNKSFEALEETLTKTEEEKTELLLKLEIVAKELKTQQTLFRLQKEIIAKFYSKCLEILGLPTDFEIGATSDQTQIEINLCLSKQQKNVLKILNGLDSKDTTNDDKLNDPELTLETILRILTSWKSQTDGRINQQQSRIKEIEAILSSEKTKHSAELETLTIKCKTYGKLIKKLRSRASHNNAPTVEYKNSNSKEPITRHRVTSNQQQKQENPPLYDLDFCLECARAAAIVDVDKSKVMRNQTVQVQTLPTKKSILKSPLVRGISREEHGTTLDSNNVSVITQNSPRSATGSVLHDLSNLQEKHQYFAHILNTVEEFFVEECTDKNSKK